MDHQDQPNEYRGAPEEVGAQLFTDAMGPTIQEAVGNGATDKQVVAMFAGMLAALAGMVSDTFGAQAALDMLRGTTERVEQFDKSGGMVQ